MSKKKKTLRKYKSVCQEKPTYLYKYVDIDSLPIILDGGSIKITNPLEFNDPFDCNIPQFDLGKADVFKIIKEEFSKKLDIKINNPHLELFLKQSKDEFEILRKEIIEQTEEMFNQWDDFISQFRVLSLTTKPDNILMWSHYAKDHKGVVLKFKCDSTFELAKKVKYGEGENLLSIFLNNAVRTLVRAVVSENEQVIDKITDITSDRMLALFTNYFYLKMDEWKYEDEYRLVLGKNNPKVHYLPEPDIDVIKFLPSELDGIIFGVSAVKNDLIHQILAEKYPDTQVQYAKKEGWSLKI
ncbi:TPA: DUF2971 domain-containing protein [Vibrio vulnificus]|nr:DUF2971 domain-containing protein [Vibrio vulnificus]HAS6277062.1 DUF2971 domain-containing protein [Vibrio vulnificus]HDY7540168.1 DUF2971 domain-containing protein [Vibrio vulnificus]HDY8048767.1 DUF2971 domain-containing protein [Vibrio vulnificus]HDY8238818.1 DUF2971 domain-containing protein [Vibrio vulnificus]